MMPFDAYKQYLSLKNHFTKDKYDYHKYCGKSRATVQSFYKRKDRFWFEKLARGKDDKEVVDFFVSNFITCTDPSKLWIGEMIREGEDRYTAWKKRNQSLSYIFKEESESLFFDNKVDAKIGNEAFFDPEILICPLSLFLPKTSSFCIIKLLAMLLQFDPYIFHFYQHRSLLVFHFLLKR